MYFLIRKRRYPETKVNIKCNIRSSVLWTSEYCFMAELILNDGKFADITERFLFFPLLYRMDGDIKYFMAVF